MPNLAFFGSVMLIALSLATLPACGQQQDETQQIITQCSDPPPDQVDSCLEQVRVQQETDPSSELGKLLAQLIKRQVEASNPPVPAPPAGDTGISNDGVAPPSSPGLDSGGTYEPPPQASPQDEAPPNEQGNPSDSGDDEATGPPSVLPGSGAGPVGSSSSPPGSVEQRPPSRGDAQGQNNTPHG